MRSITRVPVISGESVFIETEFRQRFFQTAKRIYRCAAVIGSIAGVLGQQP